MILYTSPLACSCAAHLVLIELGIPHEIEYVDIYAQPHVLISDGTLFAGLNPKNSVPALKLDSGELLTEIGVILQYLADLKPGTDLLPPVGTLARYHVMEWLSYVGSDVHKTIGPLFNPQMPEAAKLIHKQNLHRRLTYIDDQLAHQSYLTGEIFTVADAYLFVMIGWEPYFKFALLPYSNLARFHARIASRASFFQLIQLITPALSHVKLPAFSATKSRSAT
jgi:glutathione S-transferase